MSTPTLSPMPAPIEDAPSDKTLAESLPKIGAPALKVPSPTTLALHADEETSAPPSDAVDKNKEDDLAAQAQAQERERGQFRKALDEVRGFCDDNGVVRFAKVVVPQVAVFCASANIAEHAIKAYEAPEGEGMKHVRNAALSALGGVPGNAYALAASGAIESMALKDSTDKETEQTGEKGLKKAGIKAVSTAVAGKYGPLLESVSSAVESIRADDQYANSAIRQAVITGFSAVVTKSIGSSATASMLGSGAEFAALKALPEFNVIKSENRLDAALGIGAPKAVDKAPLPEGELLQGKGFSRPEIPDLPDDAPAAQPTPAIAAAPDASSAKGQAIMPSALLKNTAAAQSAVAEPSAPELSEQDRAIMVKKSSDLAARFTGKAGIFSSSFSPAPKVKRQGAAAPSPFSNASTPYG